MKKALSLAFCFCMAFSLAVTALASYNTADYIEEYSVYIPEPHPEDYGGVTAEFVNAYDAWIIGLNIYAEDREKAKSQPAAEDPPEGPPDETEPLNPIESAGSNHVVSSNHVDTPADTGAADKYPVGSWIDPAGNVFSASGDLLSPGTTPATAPDPSQTQGASFLSGVVADPDLSSVPADTDPLFLTDDTSQPVWYVEDLRPADAPAEILTGLKSLVTSIFGEYTPITTTSVISETVGDETRQYLVETVAPGAAGVDYEWIAGVVLFGIMLFCLMKLLGGVIK